MKLFGVMSFVLLCLCARTFAGSLPEVGKPMPDFFLTQIKNHTAGNARSADFRGKWLFLDFWFKGCSNCIKSFPKMSGLQDEFKDNLQIMLVGLNSMNVGGNSIETLYDQLIKKYNYHLPSAFDSVLVNQWDIETMPRIFIIDPEGILRYIADGDDLTNEKVADIISKKPVIVQRPWTLSKAEGIDLQSLFPVHEERVIYNCVLQKSKGEQFLTTGYYLEDFVENAATIRQRYGFSKVSCSLMDLYKVAYGNYIVNETSITRYHPRFILNVKDSLAFKINYTDFSGLYNFHLWIDSSKSADLQYIRSIMQHELNHVFGFKVVEQERYMPVWELRAEPRAGDKLKAKKLKGNVEALNRIIENVTIDELLAQIRMGIYNQREEAFIDKTGITGKIDIQLEGFSTDLEDVKRSLKKNGLELVRAQKKMKVLVIRDAVSKKTNLLE